MAAKKRAKGTPPKVEMIEVGKLKPHPKNYRVHPDSQIEHLRASLRQHGVYRNVVVAKDLTILAGHGLTEAAKREGFAKLPVVRLSVSPNAPVALKLLAADNELTKFAETDDRALSEILKLVKEEDPLSLLGTGYDDMNLAALVMLTRPQSEIRDFDAAAHWVGMPAYEDGKNPLTLTISFKTEEDRARFVKEKGLEGISKPHGVRGWAARWPFTDVEDTASLKFRGRKTA